MDRTRKALDKARRQRALSRAVRRYLYTAPLDVYWFKAARMPYVEQVLEWIERARP